MSILSLVVVSAFISQGGGNPGGPNGPPPPSWQVTYPNGGTGFYQSATILAGGSAMGIETRPVTIDHVTEGDAGNVPRLVTMQSVAVTSVRVAPDDGEDGEGNEPGSQTGIDTFRWDTAFVPPSGSGNNWVVGSTQVSVRAGHANNLGGNQGDVVLAHSSMFHIVANPDD